MKITIEDIKLSAEGTLDMQRTLSQALHTDLNMKLKGEKIILTDN